MIRRIIVVVTLAIFIISPSSGQQADIIPSRSLTIEGEYNPNVAEASKIMPVPERKSVPAPRQSVKYILDDKPYAKFDRDFMGAYGTVTNKEYEYRGIARLGYGMNNNLDGLFDYTFNLSGNDRLRIEAQTQGWNAVLDRNWSSRFFNAGAGVIYTHQFRSFKFELDSQFGYENFNYRKGGLADSLFTADMEDIQNILLGSVNARIVSTGTDRLKFSLSTGWSGFGRDNLSGISVKNNENLFHLDGFLSFAYGEGELGLNYNQKMSYYDWNTWMYGVGYVNNASYQVSPFITWQRDKITSKAGFHLDFVRGKREAVVISPDLSLFYRKSNKLSFLGKISGGVIDNGFRKLNAISPYWGESAQIEDGYSLADLSVGMTYNLSSFASINIKGGFEFLWNEIFQTVSDSLFINSYITQKNANVMYGEFSSLVSAGGFLDFNLFVGAYKWYSETGNDIFSYKPCLDINAKVRAKIFRTLFAKASFNYIFFSESGLKRIPAYTNLSMGLDYRYKDNLSIFLNFDNLLDRHYFHYAGYPSQRISFLAGVTYRF